MGRRGSEHRSYTLFGESRGVAERVGDVVAIVVTAFLVGAVVDDVTRGIVESTAVEVVLD